jgi:hypothetical protein
VGMSEVRTLAFRRISDAIRVRWEVSVAADSPTHVLTQRLVSVFASFELVNLASAVVQTIGEERAQPGCRRYRCIDESGAEWSVVTGGSDLMVMGPTPLALRWEPTEPRGYKLMADTYAHVGMLTSPGDHFQATVSADTFVTAALMAGCVVAVLASENAA